MRTALEFAETLAVGFSGLVGRLKAGMIGGIGMTPPDLHAIAALVAARAVPQAARQIA